MSTSYAFKPIVIDGLVFYVDGSNIKSYDVISSNWIDLSSNLNTGVLNNGVLYSLDRGGCLNFDGVDDFASFLSSDFLNPIQTMTLCTWVKYNGVYSGNYAPIIFKRNNYISSYFEQYVLAFLTSGQINFTLGDGSSNQGITTTNSYINQLIYIVGVIDTIDGVVRLYINGELNSTQSIIYPFIDVSTNPLIIGSNDDIGFPGYMGGNIYNVSIYNRVLSTIEVLQNYNAQKNKFI